MGTITPEGALKLIDRKKNILKLSQGEYVAVEKVEGAYKDSTAVEQIWVHGDSFQNFLVAVVVPTEAFVEQWASENGKPYEYTTLCKDPELVKAMHTILAGKAEEKKLKGSITSPVTSYVYDTTVVGFRFEKVKKLALDSEQFSVDNDLLTPTFKLKRPQLKRKYQTIIADLYQS